MGSTTVARLLDLNVGKTLAVKPVPLTVRVNEPLDEHFNIVQS
jgi:hypothetical protein